MSRRHEFDCCCAINVATFEGHCRQDGCLRTIRWCDEPSLQVEFIVVCLEQDKVAISSTSERGAGQSIRIRHDIATVEKRNHLYVTIGHGDSTITGCRPIWQDEWKFKSRVLIWCILAVFLVIVGTTTTTMGPHFSTTFTSLTGLLCRH